MDDTNCSNPSAEAPCTASLNFNRGYSNQLNRMTNSMKPRHFAIFCCTAAILASLAAPANAALTCRDPAGFEKWLGDAKREAAAQGISQRAIQQGLSGVTFDQSVYSRDRGQRVFKQSFEQFSARMVSGGRVTKGFANLSRYSGVLKGIESRTGVPPAVVMAIWGLESDYGVVRGNFQTIQAVATLAYDCRRTERFQNEFFSALKILDRGDLTLEEMRGAWAGEIGQAQFMPSSYLKYAVDGDGDGRADLVRSPVDVMASIGRYMQGYGWQRGAGWEPGQPNFAVIKEWNKADVYARTIAYFATKLSGGAVGGGGRSAVPARSEPVGAAPSRGRPVQGGPADDE